MLFGPERVSLHTAKQFGVLNTVQQLSSFLWRVFLRPVGDAKARRRRLLGLSWGKKHSLCACGECFLCSVLKEVGKVFVAQIWVLSMLCS